MTPRPIVSAAFALVILIASAGAQSASAKPDTANQAVPAPHMDSVKVQAIRHLLDVMGVRKTMLAAQDGMLAIYQRTMPSVPTDFWKEMQAEMVSESFLDLIIPIYDKHYSLEDIRTLSAFFETPTGQRYVAEQPAMMKESMAVGAEWGRQVGEKIMKKLKEKGYQPAS
jgi:hypothetical protein